MDTQTAGEALHPLFRVCVGFLVVVRPEVVAIAAND